MTTALASVDALTDASRGIWLVLTRHTVHVLDLDRHIYERRPGPEGSRFPFDFTPVRYSRIETPARCGSRMLVWFDDPSLPDVQEHYRYSSTIRAIIGWARYTDPQRTVRASTSKPPTRRPAPEDSASTASSRPRSGLTSQGHTRIGEAGSWRIETVNSDYLLDLDARTAIRTPVEPWPLRGDRRPVALLEVICAEVGQPLILRIRHEGSAGETVRYGTTVLRIAPP